MAFVLIKVLFPYFGTVKYLRAYMLFESLENSLGPKTIH